MCFSSKTTILLKNLVFETCAFCALFLETLIGPQWCTLYFSQLNQAPPKTLWNHNSSAWIWVLSQRHKHQFLHKKQTQIGHIGVFWCKKGLLWKPTGGMGKTQISAKLWVFLSWFVNPFFLVWAFLGGFSWSGFQFTSSGCCFYKSNFNVLVVASCCFLASFVSLFLLFSFVFVFGRV